MSLGTALVPAWYARLLAQILSVAVILAGHDWRYTALAGGFAYAVAVLGSVWWGHALASDRSDAPATIEAYILAVLPGQALLYPGALIVLSPLVNCASGDAARYFLGLRVHPSIGLGTLTIVVGLLAPRVL